MEFETDSVMRKLGVPEFVVESIADQVRRTVHQLSDGAAASQVEETFGPVGFIRCVYCH